MNSTEFLKLLMDTRYKKNSTQTVSVLDKLEELLINADKSNISKDLLISYDELLLELSEKREVLLARTKILFEENRKVSRLVSESLGKKAPQTNKETRERLKQLIHADNSDIIKISEVNITEEEYLYVVETPSVLIKFSKDYLPKMEAIENTYLKYLFDMGIPNVKIANKVGSSGRTVKFKIKKIKPYVISSIEINVKDKIETRKNLFIALSYFYKTISSTRNDFSNKIGIGKKTASKIFNSIESFLDKNHIKKA